ncbi:MAG: glycosyltransferase [Dermatophilaceae bacterium]
MRILLTACPAYGHILPLLPLARAAQRQGHEVLFATGSDLVGQLHVRGIAAEVAGPTFAGMQAIRAEAFPEFDSLPGEQRLPVSGVGLFGLPALPRAADLEVIARRWRPDLVVHEVLELGGAILARRLGVPSVTHGFGPFYPYHPEILAAATDAIGHAALAEGLLHGPYVDISPASLNPPVPHPFRNRYSLRPSPGERDQAHDLSRLAGLPRRPAVYLTLGTVFNRAPGVLASAVEAIRDLPVNLVVTTGPGMQPEALGPQPDHVVVGQFLPQTLVLERSDLLVSQCGAGGLFGALTHGLPQVCLPLGADQFLNAEAVERVGGGVTVLPTEFSVDAVRRAVAEVLQDSSYTDAAGRVQAEIESMPSPDDVLEQLVLDVDDELGAA